MTAATKAPLIGNFDPNTVETPGRDSSFITQVPGADRPLIIKIVPDPRYEGGRKAYRPARFIKYLAGPNPETDTREHICGSFFGKPSPENNAYWEYKNKLKALKAAGQGNSVDAQKLEAQLKLLKQSDKGWLLVIEPNSPKIKAVRVPQSVLDYINGREADANRPAVPNVIKKMANDGYSPFDIGQKTPKLGWLKLYKVGEKMATRYFLEPATTEVEIENNGKKYKATDYAEFDVHEKILKGDVEMSDIPDVVEFEKKYAWTTEESEEYVRSACTVVPERARKKTNQEGRKDETDEAVAATAAGGVPPVATMGLPQAAEVTKVASLDDIPF
jgi:hypothetical protein